MTGWPTFRIESTRELLFPRLSGSGRAILVVRPQRRHGLAEQLFDLLGVQRPDRGVLAESNGEPGERREVAKEGRRALLGNWIPGSAGVGHLRRPQLLASESEAVREDVVRGGLTRIQLDHALHAPAAPRERQKNESALSPVDSAWSEPQRGAASARVRERYAYAYFHPSGVRHPDLHVRCCFGSPSRLRRGVSGPRRFSCLPRV